jgi:hypothetical protein
MPERLPQTNGSAAQLAGIVFYMQMTEFVPMSQLPVHFGNSWLAVTV